MWLYTFQVSSFLKKCVERRGVGGEGGGVGGRGGKEGKERLCMSEHSLYSIVPGS